MKTNPSDSSLSLARAIIRGTRAMLPMLLAAGLITNHALAYGPPEISLDASALPAGALTSWANTGAQAGSFSNDGTTVNVGTVSGKNCVTFTGANWMKASFTAPATITGSHAYTVITQVYNPGIGGEEAYLTWAHRGINTRCAQFNYGNATGWGAVTHFSADMGFVGLSGNSPAAGAWHVLALTYDGTTEKVYVDGSLNNSAARSLNLWPGEPIYLGTSFGDSSGGAKGQAFSGSMTWLQVYPEALTASDILTLSGVYTITASATSGGSINPTGATTVLAGNSQTFAITKTYGYTADVVVDGTSQGDIASYAFTNVDANHTIAANFTLATTHVLSGTVTAAAGGGATISVRLTATGLPVQQSTSDSSGNYWMNVPAGGPYYVCASQTGFTISENQTITMSGDQTANFTLTASGRNIPQMENLLFGAIGESLPTTQGADTGNWPLLVPLASSAAKLGSPTVDYPDATGPVWAMNHNGTTQDGHRIMQITQGTVLPINGATIVTAIKPVRTGAVNNYQPVVSVLLGQLELSVRNGDGMIQVGRKGVDAPNYTSSVAIPDGQKTIISLVVQPNGTYNVYTRKLNDTVSTLAFSNVGTADMTSITAQAWWTVDVNIGKGWEGDGWSSFNGDIGDVLVYKTALSDSDRQTLESDLYNKYFTIPTYNITASAGPNGSVTPAGVTVVSRMNNQAYAITPDTGFAINDVLVDEVSVGPVASYIFPSVTAEHTIYASFVAKPVHKVSGQVTDSVSGNPLVGAMVYVSSSANASVSPAHVLTTDGSGNYEVNLFDSTWYVCASAANHGTSVDQTVTVAGAEAAGVSFALVADGKNIPQKDNLLFATLTDSLPTTQGVSTGSWAVYHPLGTPALTTMGTPSVDIPGGSGPVYAANKADGDGFHFSNTAWNNGAPASIPINGGTIVVVARPGAPASANGYQCLTSLFLSQFSINVDRSSYAISLGRKGAMPWDFIGTGVTLAQDTPVILSYVVQPTGELVLYKDGVQAYANNTQVAYTSLTPTAWFGTDINVGKGWSGDGWTSFNGDIGDVFVYKTALSPADRSQLEASLGAKFGIPLYHMITASASSGGSISPSGSVAVVDGSDKTFTFTPDSGFAVDVVTVDEVPQSGHPTSYTFTDVTADHTIAATFAVAIGGDHTITASAGAGGTIGPTGAVTVPDGTDKTFTITANAGYVVADVLVDGSSVGAVTSHTFTGVTADHTIAASFITTYASWAKSKGLDGTPGKEAGAADDPDKDGRTNLQEFAFNGNPLSGADSGQVHVLTEDGNGDTFKELVLTIAVRDTATAFTGTPSPSLAVDGITYTIEGSNDLLSPFLTQVNVVDPARTSGLLAAGTGYQYRSFSLQGKVGSPVKGFLRAKVTEP